MGINKKKLLAISKFNNADDVFTGTGLQDENIGLSMLAKLKELAEDVDDASTGDGAAKGSKTGEGEDDDLADDDFEEDEDEEDDDDYNAEKYFNNGDDDDYGDEEDQMKRPPFS